MSNPSLDVSIDLHQVTIRTRRAVFEVKKTRKHLTTEILKRNFILFTAMFLTSVYLLWRLFFTIPIDGNFVQTLFGIMLYSAELVTSLTTFELYFHKIRSDNYKLEMPIIAEEDYPHIDVFIATHNEPVDILYKTANACTFMDYPDKSKVHIYFSDDGDRPQVAELAKSLGIGYIGLSGNKDAKSGNLNNALAKTDSPLIATFDADMIGQHTFLMKTVPYFLLPEYIKDNGTWRRRTPEEMDPSYKIGLIQTPQSFYNPDLFQFNLYCEDSVPNEQDFFSKEVNTMRNAANAIAYTGSNTVIARQAMVDIGGFPLNTITEDFETSIRIQKEHYITYATDEVQAAGLTTTDFKSMIKQRKRWAQGVIQSLQNTRAVFTKKLSPRARISYLSSYCYWWSFLNRIIFILSPVVFALFGMRVVTCAFEELLLWWLPSYIFYTLGFRYLSSNVRNNRWSQIIDTIFAPYLITSVFLETIGIHERTFKITSKKKTGHQRSDLLYAIPHLILFLLCFASIIRFMQGQYGWALVHSSVIIFWLCYNLTMLLYTLFFMTGRRSFRKSERINAIEEVTLVFADRTIKAQTRDLSDHGMSIIYDEFWEIPKGTPADVIISSDLYKAQLKATFVNQKPWHQQWHYAFSVEPIDENNKRQYLQLIYDRNHSLPKTLDTWSMIYDDLYRNWRVRFKIFLATKGRETCELLDKEVTFTDGSKATLHQFNLQHLSVSHFENASSNDTTSYELVIDPKLSIKLRKVSSPSKLTPLELFVVENISAIREREANFGILVAKIKRL